ncbi:hypothetical protein ACE1B4_18440 [Aeromonas veronii]|uniref:hypothetical protein n=1 Tax=Aeromonas TaxID=642 RepID=UPI0002805B7B|nr:MULTISPECIES: hypothetical protein [Aeromonas]EKB12249.1 hypothetical protein HMPREF1167_02287 [Aeromonas veronii AER39]MBA2080574.1 hypothetical protein [Aeromonas veronii]MCF5891416.1 hypothetical protein [Aeromonas veronii]MCR3960895.1 hypothetical protein [Aeromonas veronii]MCX0425098.1 hypothetical protein [Aeromonas veronii]
MNIKKMSVLAVVASISMLMTACASPPQPTWKKEGVTDDDTLTALSQCRYEIRLNDISAEEKNEVITDCMQAKGFRWRVY